MVALLLAIQLTVNDSVYSTAALRALVTEAAAVNRVIPESLATYRARAESEVALLFGARANERVVQVEQVESELHWQNASAVEQRIVGYRTTAQPTSTSSLTVSVLTILRRPWIVPTLSGNRFRLLLIWRDGGLTPNGKTTVEVVHPLAEDRDAFYRFDGADTTTLTLPDGRSVPVIRIRVKSQIAATSSALLFNGELDLDVVGHQTVRMRGQFVAARSDPSALARLVRRGLQTVAWAELVNEEINGQYWLPAYQRIEVQGVSPFAKDFRPVFRIVSRIRNHAAGDSERLRLHLATNATKRRAENPAEHLIVMPRDSLSRFTEWVDEIGTVTADAGAVAFDDITSTESDVAADPPLDGQGDRHADTSRSSRIVRFYAGVVERFQSHRVRTGGLSVKADAGQIWSEPTTRAAVTLQWRRARWLSAIRAQRSLVRTNGLLPSLGTEPWVFTLNLAHEDGRLLGYRNTALSLTRKLGGSNGAVLHIGTGLASDRPESIGIRLTPGYAPTDSGRSASTFGIPDLQSAVSLEFHPNVGAERPTSGMGAGFAYERRDGALRWERTVGWLLARRTSDRMTYTARMDGAAVMSWRSPPQPMLEIAPSDRIPTRAYWESSGRRAALLRMSASYRLPYPGSSLQSLRWVYMPSAAPSIGIGVQSEWNDAFMARVTPLALDIPAGEDVRAGAPRVGPPAVPHGRDAIRSTMTVMIRPFGGAVGFGVGRSIDHGSRWTLSFVTDPWW